MTKRNKPPKACEGCDKCKSNQGLFLLWGCIKFLICVSPILLIVVLAGTYRDEVNAFVEMNPMLIVAFWLLTVQAVIIMKCGDNPVFDPFKSR